MFNSGIPCPVCFRDPCRNNCSYFNDDQKDEWWQIMDKIYDDANAGTMVFSYLIDNMVVRINPPLEQQMSTRAKVEAFIRARCETGKAYSIKRGRNGGVVRNLLP